MCEQHTTIEKDLATEAERPTKNMVDRLRNRLTSFKTRRGQDFQRPHCWMRDGTLTRVSALGLGRVETRRGWFLSDLRLAAKGMPRASGLDGGNQRFDANDVHDPGEIVGEH